jgi:predicted PurR-regulated permease PerM
MPPAIERRRLTLGVLILMTAVGVGLCLVMVAPFISGLVWALALGVIAMPLHRRIARLFRWQNVAALVSVAVVAIGLLTPAAFVGYQIGKQATEGLEMAQSYFQSGRWRETLRQYPVLRSTLQFINTEEPPEQASREIVPEVQRQAGATLRNVPWLALQIAFALFTLFFLFRDTAQLLSGVRSVLPMSHAEADYFFSRIAGMTHATIYGTVVVALIQGALGGLIFFVVGIPGAMLWGAVMALLAMVPNAGAFVIWIPAAIYLAAQGEWVRAAVVAAWGAVVVGTIDNVLFPALVGREMRLHTLPVFMTVAGGILMFGAAGLVLGPVTLAATVALLDIIKRRTVRRQT